MDVLDAHLISSAAGAIGGIALGLAARVGRFCTLAAIEDALFAGNTMRWRMWLLAMAVALAATQVAIAAGIINLDPSIYAQRPFNLPAILIGGLLFGLGMAFVGTCGFGTLVRLGGGDLKSFLVFLVMAVSAFMAAAGPTARLRQLLDPMDATGGLLADPRVDQILAAAMGIPVQLTAAAIALALLIYVLSDAAFRKNRRAFAWGLLVGGIIFFGWLGTAWLAADPFEPVPVQSYTFVGPLGATVMFAMTSTGTPISFGVGATLGVICGAFFGALWKREFRWEASDDSREARRQILGAFLMGTGGMYALGCTIGQGLTAVSALALSAPIALAAIWLGAWIGLTYLIEGSLRGMFAQVTGRSG